MTTMPVERGSDNVSPTPDVRERQFEVDGLTIAARHWGSAGTRVIALHGWLDNAASFDALAAALPNMEIVAVDLPGHGLSDHKPPSGNYAIWDDLRSVVGVADQLGWDRFSLIGHSRGAMMSVLLRAAQPDRVERLVCIDGLAAEPAREADIGKQLGLYISEFSKKSGRAVSYASLQEVATARIATMPMEMDSAMKIAQRACKQREDGRYLWRSDRRVSLASPVKLTARQWQAAIAVSSPALFIGAEQGFAGLLQKMFPDLASHFEIATFPGGHHFHMDVAAGSIAHRIRIFFEGHSSPQTEA